jgi:hypothetical protein
VHENVNFTPPVELVLAVAVGLAFVLFFVAGFIFTILLDFGFAAFFETTGAA